MYRDNVKVEVFLFYIFFFPCSFRKFMKQLCWFVVRLKDNVSLFEGYLKAGLFLTAIHTLYQSRFQIHLIIVLNDLLATP